MADWSDVARQFEVEKLAEQRDAYKNGFYQFLKVPTLRCGIYELRAGAKDEQKPHQEDEVYHVLKGEANLHVEMDGEVKTYAARPGSILFVAAGVAHHFGEITDDLQVLVFFSSAPTEGSR